MKAVYVKWSGEEDMCSGFVLDDHRFVTAFHCIEEKSDVQIDGWDKANAPLQNIWVPTNENIDLWYHLNFSGRERPIIRSNLFCSDRDGYHCEKEGTI